MSLLVVGGNGFIGRHVSARALAMGWQVTSLGLSGKGLQGACCVAADISDIESVRRVLFGEKFDYVVNCGGYIDHSTFGSAGRRLIRTHFDGVLNLVETLDRTSLKRFVNIGSSDEYGNLPAPQSEIVREAPISPYSQAKVAATHFLQMMHRSEDFPAVTLRLFLTYGAGQDEHRFLPQIIRGCLEDCEFPTSSGEQLRDFCYVDDTVRAIFAALDSDLVNGEVINVGSGHAVSISYIIKKVCIMVGAGNPQFGVFPYRRGENMALYADISKAHRLLGWSPAVSLEQGLRRTIAYFSGER
ncbi:MAG: NAD-dependent epimerase/dehydratase family protein [Oxalobacter sp.]|nr:MAG: NAD-dependent epimerase/dehydratase family protein [Oxalobacter sp.]